MKAKKLVMELDCSLNEAAKEKRKHVKELKIFMNELRVAERRLLKRLNKETKKAKRKLLKKKLRKVELAYEGLR